MQGYSDQEYTFLESKFDEKTAVNIIDMEVKSNTNSLTISWRVKKSKSRFYVIDLIVADISLVRTKRSEFNSMLKKVDYNLGLGPERHGDFAKEYGDAVKKVYGVDELKSRIKEIIKSTVNEVKKDEHGNHLEPQFKKGDKVTYLGNPGEITKINKTASGTYTYSVSYDKGTGKTKASDLSNKGGELKKA